MAYAPNAASALDGGDPRLSMQSGQGIAEYSRDHLRKTHDPSVTFEEYLYWAKITREEEKGLPDAKHPLRKLLGFGKKNEEERRHSVNMPSTEEKKVTEGSPSGAVVSDEEWVQASRALRSATWGAVFYLITTDILGPYSVPWAMAQMGYGPGIVLYTVFGALAGYTGYQLWDIFLKLDSNMYPMKTYGDICFRIYGQMARHLLNVLQSIQLLFNVGIIIIGNGQGIYQINSNICYIACCIIWTACGMLIGQVRTLQKFGWIANLAIWLNIAVLILTMAVVTHTEPNYSASNNLYGIPYQDPNSNPPNATIPVKTFGGSPGEGYVSQPGFTTGVAGLMQAVYSYGGAMLFCEFMSEMRKPWDFWKALVAADAFIFIVYLFFGIYVYSFQGQYTINPANQGMGPKAAYTAGNIVSFISSVIAAALYGNIGIKVLYQNILKEMFGFPDLSVKAGKMIWVAVVPIYWALAFIVAAAIPNFQSLSGLIAAVCILQFTYTFPPLLAIGCAVKKDAMQEGEGFDPTTRQTIRHDNGMKRWIRGYMVKWHLNTFNLIFMLGALVTAGLGCYTSIEGLIEAFAAGRQTAFSCKGPI